jgi:hypothetical protein
VRLWMRTIGVLPMASRMVSQIFRSGTVATDWILLGCERCDESTDRPITGRPRAVRQS